MQRVDEVDLWQLGGGVADLIEAPEAQGALEARVGGSLHRHERMFAHGPPACALESRPSPWEDRSTYL